MLSGTARLAARRRQRSSQVSDPSPLEEFGRALSSARMRVTDAVAPHLEGFANYVESVTPTSAMCGVGLATCRVESCSVPRDEVVGSLRYEAALDQELGRLVEDGIPRGEAALSEERVAQRISMRRSAPPGLARDLPIAADPELLSESQAAFITPCDVCGLAARAETRRPDITWDELFADDHRGLQQTVEPQSQALVSVSATNPAAEECSFMPI